LEGRRVEHDRTAPELSAWWRLSDAELALLETKPLQTRLGFTAQLMMYRQTGRFVERIDAFPSGIIDQLAALTETAPADLDEYPWSGRTGRRHRVDILRFLGIRRSTREDLEHASAFVIAELCPQGLSPAAMADILAGWFLERRVACLESAELGGLVTAARRRFEERVLDSVVSILSPTQKKMLDASLTDEDVVTGFTGLRADPGDANLDNILLAAQRLSDLWKREADATDTRRREGPSQARGRVVDKTYPIGYGLTWPEHFSGLTRSRCSSEPRIIRRRTSMPFIRAMAGWHGFASRSCPT
jgi:hypothetical protein